MSDRYPLSQRLSGHRSSVVTLHSPGGTLQLEESRPMRLASERRGHSGAPIFLLTIVVITTKTG